VKTLLIIVSIIGLAAVIGAIVVGRSTFDGIVVDKPYERGLTYDAAQQERETSGWVVDIIDPPLVVGRNELIISATDRKGSPLPDAEISLTISRPSSAAYDRTYAAARTTRGQFRAEIELPLYGHWDVKVRVKADGKDIIFERKVFAAQGKG